MIKLHYFDDEGADPSDILLNMCIQQGYVPPTCLLNGQIVWGLINESKDPCAGCNGPREKCKGRPKKNEWRSAG